MGKGRKSVEAVKAKSKRRRVKKKEIVRQHANNGQRTTPLTSDEDCPSSGEIEEAAEESGMEYKALRFDTIYRGS
jgi:hypothetical protein